MGGVTQPLAAQEGRSVDRLSELLGHHVQVSATAWDRIVGNGSLDRLQRPEHIVSFGSFFGDVVGVPSVTAAILLSRTAPYRAWVTRYAEEHSMPVVPAPKGQRKEAVGARPRPTRRL